MSVTYKLTIAGLSNLQQGALKSSISSNAIDLVFHKDDKIVKRANLSPDRTSLSRTLEATKNKVALICKRLGINESQLNYDRSELSKLSQLGFKLRFLKKMLFEAFIPTQWIIVYKKEGQEKWNKIIPDSRVFQADTFVVFKDNTHYLFYEELKFEDYHGYLMVAELDIDNNRLINEKVILKLEHHLSFPNVFEEQGGYYMIPEYADGNSVDLYECTSFPYEWKKKKTLIANTCAVDTTPLKTKNGWYLFTTIIEKGAGCNDELSIYKSPDLFNQPFVKLYDEPVICDVENARMGDTSYIVMVRFFVYHKTVESVMGIKQTSTRCCK
jgi:hypothetical protein